MNKHLSHNIYFNPHEDFHILLMLKSKQQPTSRSPSSSSLEIETQPENRSTWKKAEAKMRWRNQKQISGKSFERKNKLLNLQYLENKRNKKYCPAS